MGESPKLAPLDYRSAPVMRRRPPESEQERRWRYGRVAYCIGLGVLFATATAYLILAGFLFDR